MKTIIFDLDNTLYDYSKCNDYAEQFLFLKISSDINVSIDYVEQCLKRAKANVKERLQGTAAEHNRLLYMQEICEEMDISPFVYAVSWYNTYWDSFLSVCTPYDYVIPTLEYLKKININVLILTDLTAMIQFRKINALGIESYIDYIVTSEEVGSEKPSQKMFKRALRKAKCKESEVIMIGDDYEKDIYGAEKNNIRSILYDGNFNIMERIKTECTKEG